HRGVPAELDSGVQPTGAHALCHRRASSSVVLSGSCRLRARHARAVRVRCDLDRGSFNHADPCVEACMTRAGRIVLIACLGTMACGEDPARSTKIKARPVTTTPPPETGAARPPAQEPPGQTPTAAPPGEGPAKTPDRSAATPVSPQMSS